MSEDNDQLLEKKCAALEWQLKTKQDISDTLAALLVERRNELSKLKSFLVDGRAELTDYLSQNNGTSNLSFEQKKLDLISAGESRIEQALAREVAALKSRFPQHNVLLPEQWTMETFPQVLGNIVEQSVNKALALEKETIARKQALFAKLEHNERLREQVRGLEAELVAELSKSNSTMASESQLY